MTISPYLDRFAHDASPDGGGWHEPHNLIILERKMDKFDRPNY
jgi:hypothetical protein